MELCLRGGLFTYCKNAEESLTYTMSCSLGAFGVYSCTLGFQWAILGPVSLFRGSMVELERPKVIWRPAPLSIMWFLWLD